MSPTRAKECLRLIRWRPATLAEALECNWMTVDRMMKGVTPIDQSIADYLEALARVHQAIPAPTVQWRKRRKTGTEAVANAR